MVDDDLVQVLSIERNTQPMPWSRLSFEESLNNQYRCQVIEYQSSVVAFYIVCPVVDEMHILNLAVAPQHQGNGLGHVLMQEIVAMALALRLDSIFLEVRAGNSVAQSLYNKWQFEQIAVRKDYYRTRDKKREHAVVMVRKLSGESAPA